MKGNAEIHVRKYTCRDVEKRGDAISSVIQCTHRGLNFERATQQVNNTRNIEYFKADNVSSDIQLRCFSNDIFHK